MAVTPSRSTASFPGPWLAAAAWSFPPVPGRRAQPECLTATGSAKPSTTTNWYQLFFPVGTTFGQAGTQNDPWTTYSWVYTAPKTCEVWTDAILPGDDGQGKADGNITGVNACAA